MTRRLTLVVLAATVVLAGCGENAASTDKPPSLKELEALDNQAVERYCAYGAVSQSQLEGCLVNVTTGDFFDLETNAAAYGRLELDECLADAGPFCAEGELEQLEQ